MTIRKRQFGNDEEGQKWGIAEEDDGKEMTTRRRDEARKKIKE